ncbi:PREDICTED: uncharacterized protein LOC109232594 [Nicotiana attenuata]|uniref:uncharacterized protein LOC109232594 n=1 Tax=Nicotiana attenuata TaxID=49451 RepID=UPI0009051749|nr:PREDICTED: uncharacterized protein LOC109232594 [Nicotiana attenuata]
MGSLAYVPAAEIPVAIDVQALANQFVRLAVLESSRVLAGVVTVQHSDAEEVSIGVRVFCRCRAGYVYPMWMGYVVTTYSSEQLAQFYICEIVRLNDVPIAHYEAIYGRRYRYLVCWFETGKARLLGRNLVRDALEKVKLIQDRLRIAQSRQNIYANQNVRDVEFIVGERVLLHVLLMKGVMRFGKRGKLIPWYIGSFEILERVGEVSHKLALLPSLSVVHPMFHVSMLRKYQGDPSHVLDLSSIQGQ